MIFQRLVGAFAFLLTVTAAAAGLENLDFNITIPANSTMVAYYKGWTQVGGDMVFDTSQKVVVQLDIQSTSSGYCFHGTFQSAVEVYVGAQASYNITTTPNQSMICVPTPFTTNNFVEIAHGLLSISSITVMTKMQAPTGTTVADIEVWNEPFVLNGKAAYSEPEITNLTFAFAGSPAPVVPGGINVTDKMSITLPINISYFVLKSPYADMFGDVNVSLTPSWPEPYMTGGEGPSKRLSLPKWVNLSISNTPEDTPYFLSGALDPSVQYTIGLESLQPRSVKNDQLVWKSYIGWTMSSMDLYSIKKKPSVAKSIVGPVVGGVIGGIVVLLLIGLAVWSLRRRRQREQYGKEEAKFHIDSDNLVAMPFVPSTSAPTAPIDDVSGLAGYKKTQTDGGAIDHTHPAAVRNLIRESDGGGLIEGNDEFLPPLYNPSWGGPSSSASASGAGPSGSTMSDAGASGSAMGYEPSGSGVPATEAEVPAPTYPREKTGLHVQS